MEVPVEDTASASQADSAAGFVPDAQVSEVARPLDGAALAKRIKSELVHRVERLHELGVPVGLGTVLVGDDPASNLYVNWKHKDCKEVGIDSISVRLPADATQEQVLAAVDQLNADPSCTAFIVQLPLPSHLDATEVLERIDPTKDADGLHPLNLGSLVEDVDGVSSNPKPCTPNGIVTLLEESGVDLKGKRVCVVGRGLTVGRPLSLLLTSRPVGATAVLCHTATEDLSAEMREADVIVAAAGVPGMVKPEDVKPGAVVVDVGVGRKGDRVYGDIADGVQYVASALTPNPGGVGPMTRAMLLQNVVEAAERQAVANLAAER